MNGIGVIKRQFKILRREKKNFVYFLFILNMISMGVLPVLSSFIPKVIIDNIVNNIEQNEVTKVLLLICLGSLILAVIGTGCNAIFDITFLKVRIKEFNILNEKYQKIDYPNLESTKFRDYFEVSTSALNADTVGFQAVYNNIARSLPYIVSIILYALILINFNGLILISVILTTIIMIFINIKISNYIEKKKEEKAKTRRQVGYFNNVCYDFTYGKEIRVNNLKDKIISDYKQKSINYINVVKNIANYKFKYGFYELLCLLLQDGIGYYFVIKYYFDKRISLGEVSLYITIIILLSSTIRLLTAEIGSLVSNLKYSKNYFEFMENDKYEETINNKEIKFEEEHFEIEFKNVSFKYPETEKYIFKNFTFKVNKKEKLAIVGINGCGKSTFIKLITGLYKVNEGEILINGVNIDSFSKTSLNNLFSVVYQDIHIYACSVLENVIGLDDDEKSRQRGIKCIEMVGLKEKVESFEKQYDQPLLKIIEDDGTDLSGGQSQKLAIARALYKNGKIVILDEPTANLDAIAEQEIYQSFNDLINEKTAIYISHRLSSTKFCDKIALFSPEGLLEYGSHDDLMTLKGKYFEMFETQGKYYREGEQENER